MSNGTSVVFVSDLACVDLAELRNGGRLELRSFNRIERPEVIALLRTFARISANFRIDDRRQFEGLLKYWDIPKPAEPGWPAVHTDRAPVVLPLATLAQDGDAVMHMKPETIDFYTRTKAPAEVPA